MSVLDSPFFFGILNLDITENVEYPMFTVLIKDENLICN